MAKKRRGNSEGSIYFNGKDWVGQVSNVYNAKTGEFKRKSVYCKTQREAIEKVSDMTNKIRKGTYFEPTDSTVAEWTEYWLENFKKNQINETSYETYDYQIKNHIIIPFGNIKLKNLTTFHIQQYLNKIKKGGMSNTYIKMLKTTYNSVLKQAVKLEAIHKNPCDNLALPKSGGIKEIKVLTKEEQDKFVKYCYDNNEFLFIFMLGTGVRIGEALGLTWELIDFETENIKIKNSVVEIKGVPKLQEYAKTESSLRDIPMSPKVKNILINLSEMQISDKTKFIFGGKKREIKSSGAVREKLHKICQKIEIEKDDSLKITPHTLRHTFATRMLESNVNIKILSEILGHKNIQMTLDIYAHVLPDTKKDNINKIDDFI